MDNNTKRRLGVLDLAIIIVLVLCAIVFALRFYGRAEISGEDLTGKYTISFIVSDVRHTTADAFVKGDRVYVATDDTCIGVFERLDSNNPAAYYAEDPSAGIVKVYYPEGTRIDLTGTIISEGVMNDDGYFANGSYFLAPGKKISIYTGHVFVDITLSEITVYAE